MLERIAGIIFPVFAVVAIGYAYARWRGARARVEVGALNDLNLGLLVPLLCAGALSDRSFVLSAQLPLLGGALAVVLVSGVLGFLVARLAGYRTATFVPPMMFNNCGNLGLPIATLAFGPAGLAPAVAMFTVSNLLHFSLGIRMVTLGRVPWRNSLRLLASPVMAGMGIGLAAALSGLHPPAVIADALRLAGSAAVPLMLLALGARLVDANLRAWRIGLVGAIVCPLAGLAGALAFAALVPLTPAAYGQLVLFAVLPPAVMNYMIAEAYDQEPAQVASITLLGNLAALLFLPAGLLLAHPP
jgi:predicted permease